eukprot:7300419-Prorocentrum_lima.AAC.1
MANTQFGSPPAKSCAPKGGALGKKKKHHSHQRLFRSSPDCSTILPNHLCTNTEDPSASEHTSLFSPVDVG